MAMRPWARPTATAKRCRPLLKYYIAAVFQETAQILILSELRRFNDTLHALPSTIQPPSRLELVSTPQSLQTTIFTFPAP
jgi:hypothetical protein